MITLIFYLERLRLCHFLNCSLALLKTTILKSGSQVEILSLKTVKIRILQLNDDPLHKQLFLSVFKLVDFQIPNSNIKTEMTQCIVCPELQQNPMMKCFEMFRAFLHDLHVMLMIFRVRIGCPGRQLTSASC